MGTAVVPRPEPSLIRASSTMKSLVIALLCASAVGTLADHPHPAPSSSYHEPSYPDVPPACNFDWNVYNEYANNNYGHTETRNDKSTSGNTIAFTNPDISYDFDFDTAPTRK